MDTHINPAPVVNPCGSGAALLKLLQITSPSLPVGSYSYSQGLEWAVQCGWITNVAEFTQWLDEQVHSLMLNQDLPLLNRLYSAVEAADDTALTYWDAMALAMRDTAELRLEEEQRGRALVALLQSLQVASGTNVRSQTAAFAAFCVAEQITLHDALAGYAYSWADSQVTAAIKLVPLGQAQGQGILYHTADQIPAVVARALTIEDDDIGYTAPALTMASCHHETQYSRLFRS
ncbi:MAG: urease accessory protein UreF [Pseudomonadota bacterium]